MAQVQFKRGTATNFNSMGTKDPGTLYVVGNVTAYDTGSGPDLVPTPADYCELFLGGNLIGVGHLATKKRPGLIPKLPASNQTNYWLQATASGPQWANLSDAISLDDVLFRHRAQNIYGEKSVLGNDFNIIGMVAEESGDAAADEVSTHLKLFTYPGPKSFFSDNDHGSGYWTDSPNILFKGFQYNESFLDDTSITAYTQTPSSSIGYYSSASYSIGKRLYSKLTVANDKVHLDHPEGEQDYIYLESEISRFAASSSPIKNTIITVSSPNGADIIKKGGGALDNIITFEGTTVTPISGDLAGELRISPVIHIKDYSGVSTVTISGATGQVRAKSFKLDSVSGTDNTKWIRADGTASAGGLFSSTDPGIVPAYGTDWTSTEDVFLTGSGWKEIAGLGSLDLTNVMYTNTDQTVSGKKTYSQNQEITSTSTQKALILRNGSASSTTAYGNTPAILFAQGKSIFDGSSPGNYPDWKVFGYSSAVTDGYLRLQTTKTSSTWTNFIEMYAKYGSAANGVAATGSYLQLGTSSFNIDTKTYGNEILYSASAGAVSPYIQFNRGTSARLNWKVYSDTTGVLHMKPEFTGTLNSSEIVKVVVDDAGSGKPAQLNVGNAYMNNYVVGSTTYAFGSASGGMYITSGDVRVNDGDVEVKSGDMLARDGDIKSQRFKVINGDGTDATNSVETYIRANGGGYGGVFTGATSSADGSAGLVKKPLIADTGKFLKGDGTWATPANTDTKVTQSPMTASQGSYYPVLMKKDTNTTATTDTVWFSSAKTDSNFNLAADRNGNLRTKGLESVGNAKFHSGTLFYGEENVFYGGSTNKNAITIMEPSDTIGAETSSILFNRSQGEQGYLDWKVYSTNHGVLTFEPKYDTSLIGTESVMVNIKDTSSKPVSVSIGDQVLIGKIFGSGTTQSPWTYGMFIDSGRLHIEDGRIEVIAGDISTEEGDIHTGTGDISTDVGNIYTSEGNIYAAEGDIIDHGGYVKAPGFKLIATSSPYADMTDSPDTFIRANGSNVPGGVFTGVHWDSGNAEYDVSEAGLVPKLWYSGIPDVYGGGDFDANHFLLFGDGQWRRASFGNLDLSMQLYCATSDTTLYPFLLRPESIFTSGSISSVKIAASGVNAGVTGQGSLYGTGLNITNGSSSFNGSSVSINSTSTGVDSNVSLTLNTNSGSATNANAPIIKFRNANESKNIFTISAQRQVNSSSVKRSLVTLGPGDYAGSTSYPNYLAVDFSRMEVCDVFSDGGVFETSNGTLLANGSDGSVQSRKFIVLNSNDTQATQSDATFIRANGNGYGGEYSFSSSTHIGTAGLVPGYTSGAYDEFLRYDGSWASPFDDFTCEEIEASYLDSNAGNNYYPLIVFGNFNPKGSDVASLKYQASGSGNSWTYSLTADRSGNLKANKLTAASGVTVTSGGATITAGGLTVTAGGVTVTAGGAAINGGNLSVSNGSITAKNTITSSTGNIVATAGNITATAGNIVATAGNFVATAGHYYWNTNTPVCEWQDF